MLRTISSRDHRLMRRVHRWYPPRWVRMWAMAATRAGDGWLWYAIGALVLVAGGPERFRAVFAAAVSAAASIGLFQIVKRVTGRQRPCAIEPHCWATLLPPDKFSFPSGHTMTAFAVALPLGLFYHVLLPVLLFCAASIAISRVLLGMHFLSDVVIGGALGSTIGYVVFALLR